MITDINTLKERTSTIIWYLASYSDSTRPNKCLSSFAFCSKILQTLVLSSRSTLRLISCSRICWYDALIAMSMPSTVSKKRSARLRISWRTSSETQTSVVSNLYHILRQFVIPLQLQKLFFRSGSVYFSSRFWEMSWRCLYVRLSVCFLRYEKVSAKNVRFVCGGRGRGRYRSEILWPSWAIYLFFVRIACRACPPGWQIGRSRRAEDFPL